MRRKSTYFGEGIEHKVNRISFIMRGNAAIARQCRKTRKQALRNAGSLVWWLMA